jgi:signal peptidase I
VRRGAFFISLSRREKVAARKKSPDNPVAAARRGKGGRPARGKSAFRENAKSLLVAFLIYIVVRTFLIEAYRIPSGSMIPALLVGDWLFVNKLVYGPKVPFTDVHLPGYGEPRRGEVVVFTSPPQPDLAAIGEDPKPTLVKRLVGMPGDTIYMREGLLYVNGLPQRQGYAAAANPRGDPNETSPLMEWQKEVQIRGTRFGQPPTTPTNDNWGPLLLPARRFFMMGDNRYQSKDSRYWGLVPRENVKGRPMFVYYSYVPSSDSDRPMSFLTDIRWGRLGHWIR